MMYVTMRRELDAMLAHCPGLAHERVVAQDGGGGVTAMSVVSVCCPPRVFL